MRQVIWDEQIKMQRCSECGWVSPNPALDFQNRSKAEWKAEVKQRFENHNRKKYPLKPKSSS